MKVESIYELFLHDLKSVYYIEQNLLAELEELSSKATEKEFKEVIERDMGEAADHAERIEKVFKSMDEKPEMHRSRPFTGWTYEIDHLDRVINSEDLLNIAYLNSVIRIKMLEISVYEGLLMLTKEIEISKEDKKRLRKNLKADREILSSLKALKSDSTLKKLMKGLGM